MNVFSLYGDVDIRGTGEASGALSSLGSLANKVGSKMKSLGSTMTNVGQSMMTFVTLPIAGALGYSIKNASDLNETVSKTGVVFDDASNSVMKWSKNTLTNIGLAQGTALDMAATYGDMATSMGLNTTKAAKLSMSMVDLAGDMASFKNMKPEEVHTALTGVFTGETEALKSLGIVMTETNLIEYAKQQGIKKSIKDMTQAEKVQLRYNYVMDMAKNSQGDFKNTQASAANQMRIFMEGLKELSAQIGTILLPYFTQAVTWLNQMLVWFRELDPSIQKVAVVVALLAAGIGPLLIVGGTLISALGTIISVLAAVSIEIIAVVAVIAGLVAIITAVVVKSVGWSTIMEKIKSIIPIVTGFVSTFWEALTSGGNVITAILAYFQDLMGRTSSLGQAIGTLKVAWISFYEKIKTLLATLWTIFIEAFQGIWEVVGPFFQRLRNEAAPIFFEIVAEIMNLLGVLADNFSKNLKLIWAVWKDIWSKIKPYVQGALNLTVTIIKNALTIIKNAIKLAKSVMTGDWRGAWDAIKNIIRAAANTMKATTQSLKTAMVNIIKSLVSSAKSKFSNLKSGLVSAANRMASALKQAGKNLMNMFLAGIKSKISSITSTVSGVASKIKGYLGFSSPTDEGPGRDSDKWMPNMMDMFGRGIIKNIPAIQKALEIVGSSIESFQPTITPSYAASSVKGAQGKNTGDVILQVNNPKMFDKSDVDKFMNPVIDRLRRTIKF